MFLGGLHSVKHVFYAMIGFITPQMLRNGQFAGGGGGLEAGHGGAAWSFPHRKNKKALYII